jgi:septum site-determining protein MinC
MSKTPLRKPLDIKISTVVAVAAILHEADLAVLNAALLEMTGGVPDYFDNEFAVLDVGPLAEAGLTVDWTALIQLFKSHRLNPVAVRNAAPAMEPDILAHGLSLDMVVAPRQPASEPALVSKEPEPPAALPPVPMDAQGSLIVDTPVRAGQRIYAQGSDLIVTAAVNNGAELIADGSIHIYAPLRGRALAGASGNGDARIFAMSMEAELVSVAGIYRTFEDGLPKELAQRPAQVRLCGDRIEVVTMSALAR